MFFNDHFSFINQSIQDKHGSSSDRIVSFDIVHDLFSYQILMSVNSIFTKYNVYVDEGANKTE